MWHKADWRWLKMAELNLTLLWKSGEEPSVAQTILHRNCTKCPQNKRRVISLHQLSRHPFLPSASSTLLGNLATKGSCIRKTKQGPKLIKHHEEEQTFEPMYLAKYHLKVSLFRLLFAERVPCQCFYKISKVETFAVIQTVSINEKPFENEIQLFVTEAAGSEPHLKTGMRDSVEEIIALINLLMWAVQAWSTEHVQRPINESYSSVIPICVLITSRMVDSLKTTSSLDRSCYIETDCWMTGVLLAVLAFILGYCLKSSWKLYHFSGTMTVLTIMVCFYTWYASWVIQSHECHIALLLHPGSPSHLILNINRL